MDASTSTLWLMPLMALFSQSDKSSWLSYIPLCIPLLIPLFPKQFTMPSFLLGCFRKSPVLSFTSRLRLTHWDSELNSFVRNFSIVLWEWNRLNQTVNCKNLLEESIHPWADESSSSVMPLFVDDMLNRFWHQNEPSILYSMWVETITDREGHVIKDILLRIEFTDADATPPSVVKHTEYILTEAKRLEQERNRTQRVLVSTNASLSSSSDERGGRARDPVPLMAYEFNTTSSFDNFFSEEATLVQNDLKHFLEDKEAYRRSGRPWTYTVLNEGPPGVGKTKLVKAIAALTGYTLIVVNLTHIQSIQMLYELFHTSTLAGETVPHNKRIYYLPELDTQLVDLVKSREVVPQVVVPVPGKPLVTPLVDTKQIGLGEILNVLDGVPERHGHILILDTNHLKELDPALIRPGRVDRILSWKKMSAASVRRFLENYYSAPVPSATKLPDRAFSAAELQSLVAQHGSLKELVGRLGQKNNKKN